MRTQKSQVLPLTLCPCLGVKYLQDLAKHNPRDYATAILEEDKLRGPPEELIEPSFLGALSSIIIEAIGDLTELRTARTDREMHQ